MKYKVLMAKLVPPLARAIIAGLLFLPHPRLCAPLSRSHYNSPLHKQLHSAARTYLRKYVSTHTGGGMCAYEIIRLGV